jgi:hypothetical protein
VLVAGCGSSTTTVNVTSTPTTTVTVQPATTTSSTTAVVTPSTTTTITTPSTHLSMFESPSRNIGCMVVAGTARCDIRHRQWSPPPRPANCPSEVDFGQGVAVGRSGPGQLVCAGDTALDPSAPTLAYGSQTAVRPFTCQSSATAGVTCRNGDTGHGFSISIQSYRVF